MNPKLDFLTQSGQWHTLPGMTPDEMSAQLKAKREALNLTQDQLAQELGVDITTVGRWERGTRSIPPYLFLALNWIELEHHKKPKRKG